MTLEELRAALPPVAILARCRSDEGQTPGRGPEFREAVVVGNTNAGNVRDALRLCGRESLAAFLQEPADGQGQVRGRRAAKRPAPRPADTDPANAPPPAVRNDDRRGSARLAAVPCGVVSAADRDPGLRSGHCGRRGRGLGHRGRGPLRAPTGAHGHRACGFRNGAALRDTPKHKRKCLFFQGLRFLVASLGVASYIALLGSPHLPGRQHCYGSFPRGDPKRVLDGPRFAKIRVRIFRVRGCAGARKLREVCISVYDMKREEARCHSKRP
jgi:hypothetical protein